MPVFLLKRTKSCELVEVLSSSFIQPDVRIRTWMWFINFGLYNIQLTKNSWTSTHTHTRAQTLTTTTTTTTSNSISIEKKREGRRTYTTYRKKIQGNKISIAWFPCSHHEKRHAMLVTLTVYLFEIVFCGLYFMGF